MLLLMVNVPFLVKSTNAVILTSNSNEVGGDPGGSECGGSIDAGGGDVRCGGEGSSELFVIM